MNREELFKHHKSICAEALGIMEKKNHDYAGEAGDSPFANFTRSEDMGICTTEQGFLVRLCDLLASRSVGFAIVFGCAMDLPTHRIVEEFFVSGRLDNMKVLFRS